MSGFPRLDPSRTVAALKQLAAEHRVPVELNIDGDVVVLHPDDRLIVRARTPVTAETVHRILTTAARVLGPDRTLVLDATFDVDIDRSELRGELVQLAAMTVAWIAALDGEALA